MSGVIVTLGVSGSTSVRFKNETVTCRKANIDNRDLKLKEFVPRVVETCMLRMMTSR